MLQRVSKAAARLPAQVTHLFERAATPQLAPSMVFMGPPGVGKGVWPML